MNQQYLYRIQPTRPDMLREGPTEDESRIVSAHFDYLKGLTDEGIVMLAGRTLNTDPSSFGIVIFTAESEVAAQAIVDADPAVSAGIMNADLFPYRTALFSSEGLQTASQE